MAKWIGAHYNQEVRFSSAVKCKKGPQVLTSLLNQKRNYYYYIKSGPDYCPQIGTLRAKQITLVKPACLAYGRQVPMARFVFISKVTTDVRIQLRSRDPQLAIADAKLYQHAIKILRC